MEQILPTLQSTVFTLLVRLGIASAMAALVARSTIFQRFLSEERRALNERLRFVLLYGPLVSFGVLTRISLGYQAADVSLEGALAAGLVDGRMTGLMVGAMAGLPSFLNDEPLSLLFCMLCGAVGGILRDICVNKEQVWRFGPFMILALPRMLWRFVAGTEGGWLFLPLTACIGLEFVRVGLGQAFPDALFYFEVGDGWQMTLPFAATFFAVAMTLMIWNNTRIQLKLRDQEQVVLQARMEVLTSQINPHFLFNTLNTAVSLTRANPESARTVLVKLSTILRRLLGRSETFVPLSEELEFIDNYVDIETARFGPEKLRFHKEVDADTLNIFVPNMLLQPIIENAIKHGLAPRIEGGEIRLRTARHDGRLVIEIRDTGIGIPQDRIPKIFASGIGMSNVHERLKVLYGKDFVFELDSKEGEGTFVRIEIPEAHSS